MKNIYSVAITPDSKTIVVIVRHEERYRRCLYSIDEQKLISMFDVDDNLNQVVFNADGSRSLYYGAGYNSAHIVETYTNQHINFLSQFGRTASIYTACLNKRGDRAFSCSENSTVKVWGVDSRDLKSLQPSAKMLLEMKLSSSYSTALMKLSDDEKSFFIAQSSGFGIYSTKGKVVAEYKDADAGYEKIILSRDWKYVAIVQNSILKVFQIKATGFLSRFRFTPEYFKLLHTFRHEEGIDQLYFTPDSSLLAVTSCNRIYFYSTETFKLIHKEPFLMDGREDDSASAGLILVTAESDAFYIKKGFNRIQKVCIKTLQVLEDIVLEDSIDTFGLSDARNLLWVLMNYQLFVYDVAGDDVCKEIFHISLRI